jgi:hypothetical protein
MNKYTVTVWNTDDQATRKITMHGSTENEILSRAQQTIGDADQVTDITEDSEMTWTPPTRYSNGDPTGM